MKKTSKISKSIWIMSAVAVVLLATSALAGTRAALTYVSDNYTARLQVSQMGVTLLENEKEIVPEAASEDDAGTEDEPEGVLLKNMLDEDEKLILGKNYDERLAVKNTGDIDQYVRVRIVKNWSDAKGNKLPSLSPDYIRLNYANSEWLWDVNADTPERTILLYPKILKSGETTSLISDAIGIDHAIASKVKEETKTENGITTTTTTYAYDGAEFHVKAQVDAVQTHNAKEAIKSAWGIDVNVADDGTLSLQ